MVWQGFEVQGKARFRNRAPALSAGGGRPALKRKAKDARHGGARRGIAMPGAARPGAAMQGFRNRGTCSGPPEMAARC